MEPCYLITGASGFVAAHFLNYLEAQKEVVKVVGIDVVLPLEPNKFQFVQIQYYVVNLLDAIALKQILTQTNPNFILHLASFSSVSYSWKNPVESFSNNTNIFLNLVDQVRQIGLKCRILSVGSSEEYGKVNKADLPLKENLILHPNSPYAVARLAQEMMSTVYVDGYGMDIILTRSFNHIGAMQKDVFVIPSLAKQLVLLKRSGKKNGEIKVGDISVIRDFVDVRDVVRAYDSLLKMGKPGRIYNICSGIGYSLREILDEMAAQLEMRVSPVVDRSLMRPSENPEIVGSYQLIYDELGWEPHIKITESLRAILTYWQEKG